MCGSVARGLIMSVYWGVKSILKTNSCRNTRCFYQVSGGTGSVNFHWCEKKIVLIKCLFGLNSVDVYSECV